jgi:peptidyl-prolyl cis-trans isomerase C
MMRNLLFSLGLFIGLSVAAFAADEKPAMPGDAVVVIVNGQKITADEVKKMLAGMPTQVHTAFQNDPKQFFREHAWFKTLEANALKKKLYEQSPWKEALEFQRMTLLVQAEMNDAHNAVLVKPEEQRAHYEKNLEKYREVQAKLIYIPFTGTDETEAKQTAQKVVQQARGGVEFVKLVKEYSKDSGSAAQNGDIGFPVRSTTAQVPENMRTAILALKQGQVSEPLRHQNGYYVFRAESVGVLPYDKVANDIYVELKDAGFNKYKDKTKAEATVQFANEAFFQDIAKQAQQQQQQPAKQ